MLKALYAVLTLGLCVCLLLSFERPAMAYVDPGSGLFIFQSISSIGVGVLFFLRRRLRSLLGRSKDASVSGTNPAEATPAYSRYDNAA